MKIVTEFPPNIEKIRARFKLHPGIIFTYGDTIYNPDDGSIDKALFIHESTHTRQQGDDIEGWWNKYLKDDKFRFMQEVEAYRNQYEEQKKHIKDKNQLNRFLLAIAKDLSGEMYGNIVTFSEAIDFIKN